jgi:hypothetical protein
MKKNVLIFGTISGVIVSTWMVISMAFCKNDEILENGMIYGYAGMLMAFSMIFVGIRNFRDKYNGGVITFGKAFRTGLYIALVASTIYVAVWLVDYYVFIPDFGEKYTAHILKGLKAEGASQEVIDTKMAQMAKMWEMYKNPLFVILMTYVEILPIGLVISVIAALILKRKALPGDQVEIVKG